MNPTLKDPRRDPAALKAAQERQIILARLRDYELLPTDELRRDLISRWKAEHPEAAAEQSEKFQPLTRM